MSTETPGPTSISHAAVPQPRSESDGHPTAGGAARAASSPVPGANYRQSVFWRIYTAVAQAVDHKVGWDRLPLPAGLAVLIGVRTILRQQNLHDPSTVVPRNGPTAPPRTPDHLVNRSVDGSHNDLDFPDMGMAGARFGRNIPLDKVQPVTREQLMEPSPREVSRKLMTRTTFLPAESVNTLAAAWLQFMIRDWFSHGEGDTSRLVEIPLAPDDDWHQNPMQIPRIHLDPTRPEGAPGPVTTVNELTHWWDGSSLYGSTAEQQHRVRSHVDGKLQLTADGRIPLPDDPALDPTRMPGWWTGLGMLSTLFAREHNAVCDRLKADYPHWDDEELFQRARLVVAALLAKIHTAEWTPAVISHPTTVFALRANWFGVAGERIARTFGRISDSEVISGIPGCGDRALRGAVLADRGVHQRLPDAPAAARRLRPPVARRRPRRCAQLTFRGAGRAALEGGRRDASAWSDLFYSFGTTHPGAIVLRNFPHFLQEFDRPDGKVIDLAATDIVRIRELGVPRYCEFRRLLHLAAPTTFAELTDDAELAAEMERPLRRRRRAGRPDGRAVRGEAADRVRVQRHRVPDLHPDGVAPAQQRPVLHARTSGRRSTRRRGWQWMRDNDMRTVLLRHFPELRPAMRGVDNAFAPWKRVTD